jgi:hypothetical protein
VLLVASAIASVVGHWKLGIAVPVWDAAAMLQAQSQAQIANFDKQHLVAGEVRLAVNVLSRSAQHSQAALVYEALGHMRARDGDLSGALKEIRKAANVAEKAMVEGASTDSIEARVRVEEAELLLRIGDHEKAIDAVSTSMAAEGASSDTKFRPARLRVQSMKVLITAAIRLNPSLEELAGVQDVFEKTKDSIQGHADAATKAIMYDVAASLAEAKKDWHSAADSLHMALAELQKASRVGHALKRAKDRDAGAIAYAAQAGVLHARLTQIFQKRDSAGDPKEAAIHRRAAMDFLKEAGVPGLGDDVAAAIRAKENAEYVAAHTELSQAIDSLTNVLQALKDASQAEGHTPKSLEQVSGLAGVSEKDKMLVAGVLEISKTSSQIDVIAVLEKVKLKSEAQRRALEDDEKAAKEKFEAEAEAKDAELPMQPQVAPRSPPVSQATVLHMARDVPSKETGEDSTIGGGERTTAVVEEAAGNKSENEGADREKVGEVSKDNAPSSTKRAQRRHRHRESMLIASMKSVGSDGDDTVACVTHCRYGEHARHPFPDCLERCIENPHMRSTFLKMLPSEHHAARNLDDAIPDGLQLPDAEQLKRINRRAQLRKQSSEL